MAYSFVVLLFVLLCNYHRGTGYPHGSPNCDTTVPSHQGYTAQTSPPPYSITAVSKFNISPGSLVPLFLDGTEKTTFKGFILKALTVGPGPQKELGDFSFIQSPFYHTLDCDTQLAGAITHSDNSDKGSIATIWTAPTDYTGQVLFTATLVQDFETFWLNVNSLVYNITSNI